MSPAHVHTEKDQAERWSWGCAVTAGRALIQGLHTWPRGVNSRVVVRPVWDSSVFCKRECDEMVMGASFTKQ